MKITIDLTFICNALIFISESINFNRLFASVFCLAAFLTVVKITLNMLAEKKIKFSIPITLAYLLLSGAMFALAYTEYKFVSAVFTDLAEVLFYSIGEFAALIAIYVAFLLFARPRRKKPDCGGLVADEFTLPETYVGRIEEVKLDEMPVARLVARSDKGAKTKVVDIEGALRFIDGEIANGKSALKPIRDKVAFYCGAELKDADIELLNDLFNSSVRH